MNKHNSVIEKAVMKDNKIWNNRKGDFIKYPEDMLNFLKDVEIVCKKHKMTISHEDGHGAFEIEGYDEFNLEWLAEANDAR